MEIKDCKGEGNVLCIIDKIPGDMDGVTDMRLLQQADGDVVLTLNFRPILGPPVSVGIEFCTSSGGGHYPIIARKLRELIGELRGSRPQYIEVPWQTMEEMTRHNQSLQERGSELALENQRLRAELELHLTGRLTNDEHVSCKCIAFLAENGYVQSNVLSPVHKFLLQIKKGKVTKAPYCQINYCPSCGDKLVASEEKKSA